MSRQSIYRLAFVGVLLGLIAQFFVAKKLEEPYPAIMFPGFGKVLPANNYPYPYERLRCYAYSSTDSIALTLNDLFSPFPEEALYIPMRRKLKKISQTITSTSGTAQERELLEYLRERTDALLGGEAQRLELAFYQYHAERDGKVRLVAITDRKRFIFN